MFDLHHQQVPAFKIVDEEGGRSGERAPSRQDDSVELEMYFSEKLPSIASTSVNPTTRFKALHNCSQIERYSQNVHSLGELKRSGLNNLRASCVPNRLTVRNLFQAAKKPSEAFGNQTIDEPTTLSVSPFKMMDAEVSAVFGRQSSEDPRLKVSDRKVDKQDVSLPTS